MSILQKSCALLITVSASFAMLSGDSLACSPPSWRIYKEQAPEDIPSCIGVGDGDSDSAFVNQCRRHLRVQKLDCDAECRSRDFDHQGSNSDYDSNRFFGLEFDSGEPFSAKYLVSLGHPDSDVKLEEAFDDAELVDSFEVTLRFEPPSDEEWDQFGQCDQDFNNRAGKNPRPRQGDEISNCSSATSVPSSLPTILLTFLMVLGRKRRRSSQSCVRR